MDEVSERSAGRWAEVAVGVGVGLLLLLAAWLKVSSPRSFVAVVVYLLPEGMGESVGRVAAAGVVGWEVLVGAGLVLGVRGWAAPVAGWVTIAVFSVTLVWLASQPDAPSCGCFGPLGAARRAGMDLGPGLARNGAILVALGWLCVRRWSARRVASPAGSSRAVIAAGGRPAGGFTLVELLVCIAVVALVAAIALPGLRGGRRQGMLASSLAAQRQLLAGLSMYCQEHEGSMPALLGRGEAGGEVVVGRAGVSWHGYFRDQSRHWHTLVNPGYVGLPEDALAIPPSLAVGGSEPRTGAGVLWAVRYHLTHTALAAPALWVDRPAGELRGGLDVSLLRPMRMSDLESPSGKGLLIDVALGFHNPDGDPLGGKVMPVGWGDGSASPLDLSSMDRARYVLMPPLGGNGLPVWATRDGFKGRDRD